MAKRVTTVFGTVAAAGRAADELVAAGFRRDDISILMSDETHGKHFKVAESTHVTEGAAAGAAAGGALGAIAAALVATGTVVVPPLGIFAAGPLVAALTGIGAGSTLGTVLGAAFGASIPDHEIEFVDSQLQSGGALLGIEVHDDNDEQAKAVLIAAGADKVRVY